MSKKFYLKDVREYSVMKLIVYYIARWENHVILSDRNAAEMDQMIFKQ